MEMKKVQLTNEEFVICFGKREFPMSAIKVWLLGIFIIMIALLSYFAGQQMQDENMKWMVYYSQGALTPNGEIVKCFPILDSSGKGILINCNSLKRNTTIN